MHGREPADGWGAWSAGSLSPELNDGQGLAEGFTPAPRLLASQNSFLGAGAGSTALPAALLAWSRCKALCLALSKGGITQPEPRLPEHPKRCMCQIGNVLSRQPGLSTNGPVVLQSQQPIPYQVACCLEISSQIMISAFERMHAYI